MLVWVCGCSSANPAFDPPLAGDTEGIVDTTTGNVDAETQTADTGTETTDSGTVPVPGTCESARIGEQVVFHLRPPDDGAEVRVCGSTIELIGCTIENVPMRGWTVGSCTESNGLPDGMAFESLDLMISPPPDQIEGTVFNGDVIFHHADEDAGCKFESGYIKQVDNTLQTSRLVWAGANVLDPGGNYPVSAESNGPYLDNCECGSEVGTDACNEAYGPQQLYMCYEGWIACANVDPNGIEAIVDVPPLQYGIIILEAFEPERPDVEGEYSHVVRLGTDIEPSG